MLIAATPGIIGYRCRRICEDKMFTGAAKGNIVRDAAKKAAAAEPPVTFLGTVPTPEIKSAIPLLRKGDKKVLRRTLEAAVAYLKGTLSLTVVFVYT